MRENQAPIKSVTIVGGGTAGWMTAALLSKLFMGMYEIRLIESEEIGIIGVGEATIPAIKIFNQLLDINEVDMIKATQGTFKLGIEFVNWRNKNHTYFHSFGKIGSDLLWMRAHQFWLKMLPHGSVKDFDHYAINTVMARQNKFSPPASGPANSPMLDIDYAYQFDAALYGQFLRKLAEGRGVKRTEGRIITVALRPEDGFIDHVVMQSGEKIGADLFIDCSGQRGLLINHAMKAEFESYSKWLLCNAALALPCTSVEPLTPYTRSTAHTSGWTWRIPLQHRIGNGHVYSSTHISDEEAYRVLLENIDGTPLAEPKPVKFDPGKRRKTWIKNCVAIGLAAGFLEPLESTAIHLIQTAILRLIALFPTSEFHPSNIAEFNRQTDIEYADIRDFIIAHYKVTEREETPFWAYCKHMDVPDALAHRLDLFKNSARFFKRGEELFREESWVQVLLGQGLRAEYDPNTAIFPKAELASYLKDIEEVIADVVKSIGSHQDFINANCKA